MTSKSPVGDISVVTLIRTDTTLDHSQKAEKVCWSSSLEARMLVWQGRVAVSLVQGCAFRRRTSNFRIPDAPHRAHAPRHITVAAAPPLHPPPTATRDGFAGTRCAHTRTHSHPQVQPAMNSCRRVDAGNARSPTRAFRVAFRRCADTRPRGHPQAQAAKTSFSRRGPRREHCKK